MRFTATVNVPWERSLNTTTNPTDTDITAAKGDPHPEIYYTNHSKSELLCIERALISVSCPPHTVQHACWISVAAAIRKSVHHRRGTPRLCIPWPQCTVS